MSKPKTYKLTITGNDLNELIKITNYTQTLLQEKGKTYNLVVQHNIITNLANQVDLIDNTTNLV